MFGQLHVNHVLYKSVDGKRNYRQIAVVEGSGNFETRVFGGTVVQLDPKFIAEGSDAEVYFHDTLESALDDAKQEYQQSVDSGEWTPYDPASPLP